MIASATTTVLLEGLQSVLHAISTRAPLPVLRNVKIDCEAPNKMILTATDMNLGFSIRRTLPAVVEESGSITAEGRMLNDVIGSFPANTEASISLKEGLLAIHWDKGEHSLPTIPADDFPVVPEISDGQNLTISGSSMEHLIKNTEFASSNDPTSGVCTGILMETEANRITLVATDTHRMAIAQATLAKEATDAQSVIIPAKVLREIKRILGSSDIELLEMDIDASHIQFRTPEMLTICQRLQGQFPDYQRVVPKETQRTIEANVQEFLAATRSSSIHAPQHSHRVILRIQNEEMCIESEAPEAGSGLQNVPITLAGEKIDIAFNASFIIDFLSIISSEKAELGLNENHQAAILRPAENDAAGKDFRYVVMPMQLPEG